MLVLIKCPLSSSSLQDLGTRLRFRNYGCKKNSPYVKRYMVVEGDNNVDNTDLTLWSEKEGAPAGHGWKIKNKSTDVSLETLSHAASNHCYNDSADECIHFKMDGAVKYGVTKPTTLNEGVC